MSKTWHCAEWEEKLSLYVDGVLNPFDENAVEAHLSRCESCRATVALWRSVG
ncbi:MAG: anti-sigma factor family protein, partial [Fimbriimonadales bacterium]